MSFPWLLFTFILLQKLQKGYKIRGESGPPKLLGCSASLMLMLTQSYDVDNYVAYCYLSQTFKDILYNTKQKLGTSFTTLVYPGVLFSFTSQWNATSTWKKLLYSQL